MLKEIHYLSHSKGLKLSSVSKSVKRNEDKISPQAKLVQELRDFRENSSNSRNSWNDKARQGYRKVVFQRLFDVVLADAHCTNHHPNHPFKPKPLYRENGVPKPVLGRCYAVGFRNFLHFSQLRSRGIRIAGCSSFPPNTTMALEHRKQRLQRMEHPIARVAVSPFDIDQTAPYIGPRTHSKRRYLDKANETTTKLGRHIKPSVFVYVGPRRPIHGQLQHRSQFTVVSRRFFANDDNGTSCGIDGSQLGV